MVSSAWDVHPTASQEVNASQHEAIPPVRDQIDEREEIPARHPRDGDVVIDVAEQSVRMAPSSKSIGKAEISTMPSGCLPQSVRPKSIEWRSFRPPSST